MGSMYGGQMQKRRVARLADAMSQRGSIHQGAVGRAVARNLVKALPHIMQGVGDAMFSGRGKVRLGKLYGGSFFKNVGKKLKSTYEGAKNWAGDKLAPAAKTLFEKTLAELIPKYLPKVKELGIPKVPNMIVTAAFEVVSKLPVPGLSTMLSAAKGGAVDFVAKQLTSLVDKGAGSLAGKGILDRARIARAARRGALRHVQEYPGNAPVIQAHMEDMVNEAMRGKGGEESEEEDSDDDDMQGQGDGSDDDSEGSD